MTTQTYSPELTGLPNTRGKKRAEFFRSKTKAIAILRRGLAATASGDCGAINIWFDDSGMLRAERFLVGIEQESVVLGTLKDAAKWISSRLLIITDQTP